MKHRRRDVGERRGRPKSSATLGHLLRRSRPLQRWGGETETFRISPIFSFPPSIPGRQAARPGLDVHRPARPPDGDDAWAGRGAITRDFAEALFFLANRLP